MLGVDERNLVAAGALVATGIALATAGEAMQPAPLAARLGRASQPGGEGYRAWAFGDRLALLAREDSLGVVDLIESPGRRLGAVAMPLQLAPVPRALVAGGERWAYAIGQTESGGMSIAAIDLADPQRPVTAGPMPFDGPSTLSEPVLTDGYLFFGGLDQVEEKGDWVMRMQVLAFDVRRGDRPVRCGAVVVDSHWGTERGNIGVTASAPALVREGQRLYVGARSGLVVVDIADPEHLRVTGRLPLEEEPSWRSSHYQTFSLGNFGGFQVDAIRRERLVGFIGERLYVERFWPHELVALDLADRDRPQEVDRYLADPVFGLRHSTRFVDGGLMVLRPRRVYVDEDGGETRPSALARLVPGANGRMGVERVWRLHHEAVLDAADPASLMALRRGLARNLAEEERVVTPKGREGCLRLVRRRAQGILQGEFPFFQ